MVNAGLVVPRGVVHIVEADYRELLAGQELVQREQAPPSPYLFTTERRTPMSAPASESS